MPHIFDSNVITKEKVKDDGKETIYRSKYNRMSVAE